MLALVGIILTINTMSAGLALATFSFFVPIPYVFYTKEYTWKYGIVLLFATIILGIMIAPIEQVILCVLYGSLGVIYGEGVRRKLSDKVLFFMTFIGTIIVYFITIILFGTIYGYDVLKEISTTTELVRGMISNQVVVDPTLLANLVFFIFFVSLILQAALEAIVIHLLSTILFMYLKHPPVKRIKLSEVQYPYLGGVMSAALFLFMIYTQNNQVFSDYKLIIGFFGSMGFVYLAYLGLLFFSKSKRFSKWKVYSIILFIFTLSFYAPIHLGIGLFTSLSGFWRQTHE